LRKQLFCFFISFLLLKFSSHVLATPKRIVSINLCTDQLLLMLAPREHILSLSHLATDRNYSFMWQEARGIPGNDALVEQIIPLEPDLILAGDYTSTQAVNMLKQLGYRVEVLALPQLLDDIEQFTLSIGELLGQQSKAQQLLDTMNQRIAAVKQQTSDVEKPLAVLYAPNGYTAGTQTFKHQLVTMAGYRNLASELGIELYGNLSVEQLLSAQPDVMIVDDSSEDTNSLAHAYTKHPALQRLLGDTGVIKLPTNQTLCGGPMAADAIETLARHP
jgi:iron complex transport system substrate-binding protein